MIWASHVPGGETPDNVPDMAKAALAFADAIGLACVNTLGWSLGGYVGQALALLAPDRVRKLVIAGSGPGAVTEGSQKTRPPGKRDRAKGRSRRRRSCFPIISRQRRKPRGSSSKSRSYRSPTNSPFCLDEGSSQSTTGHYELVRRT